LRCAVAPVNAPFSWPNNSDSSTLSASAAQLTAMNGSSCRGDQSCSARANSSLPVPDSPRSNTGEWLRATRRTLSSTALIAGVLPMIPAVGSDGAFGGVERSAIVFSSRRCSCMSHSRSLAMSR
jgi:hypothetical protein